MSDQVKVEPLHHSSLLRKALLDRTNQNFASPTDNLMSPCTAKLQAHRNKYFTKTKPQMLFPSARPTPANQQK